MSPEFMSLNYLRAPARAVERDLSVDPARGRLSPAAVAQSAGARRRSSAPCLIARCSFSKARTSI